MEENEEEERRLDLMMELERIKALEAYEDRESRRAEERYKGRAVLVTQIEERASERQRQVCTFCFQASYSIRQHTTASDSTLQHPTASYSNHLHCSGSRSSLQQPILSFK